MKETADKVYRNAKVYSVALDGTETHAEALVIKVGKSAELVVLDSNIETTPADQIQDIKVLETVFKGKTVFKNT